MGFFKSYYFVPLTVDDFYVDGNTTYPSRIYAQYRNKPKAVAWYKIVRAFAEKINATAQEVRLLYDIDAASGDQLNIIGRIVVLPRSFVGNVPLNPGLFAEPDGDVFGDELAIFSALTIDTDENMSDELYKLAIKSKIIKNNSDASIESILYGMNFLLPNADVLRVMDNEDMSFSVEFYGKISELQRWALLNVNLVPKPQGVLFNGFFEGYDYVQADDSSEQFGDENAQFVGFTGV